MLLSRKRKLPLLLFLLSSAALTGCGAHSRLNSSATQLPNGLGGRVSGGQQPLSGATIQLYAVGTTGDGSTAMPLITSIVAATSDGTGVGGNISNNNNSYSPGTFRISGLYTCPTPTTLVYLAATGGNPGLIPAVNNTAIVMLTALGQCQTLATMPFININEITTVGAVAALAPYITSYSAIGSGPSDTSALATAFTLASEYVDPTTGQTPGSVAPPAGLSIPSQQIITLADILSACVNTSGKADDSPACSDLFTDTSTGTPPSDTLGALINIVNNPSNNIEQLLDLIPADAPFAGALSIPPPDWSVALDTTSPTLAVSPSSIAFPATEGGLSAEPQTVTLTNNGTAFATINGISVTGANPGYFGISNNCPQYLTAGSNCTITATFAPTATGVFYADISISSSATTTPVIVPMSGTGIADAGGTVTLTPSSLTFTTLGATQPLTLTNYGSTPLNISSISATDSGIFSETNNCGTVLPAQSICTINVTNIQLNGTFTGALNVVDDAAAGNMQTSTLNSNGGTFEYITVPTTDFGNIAVGSTAGITISSATVGNLFCIPAGSVGGPPATGIFCTGSSSFRNTSQMLIAFAPATVGAYSTVINDGYNLLTFTGTAYAFTVTPQSSFNTVDVGSSQIVDYSIANVTSSALTLTPAMSGPNASDFSLTNSCPSSLSGNGTCTMAVEFTPSARGTRTATLTVTDTTSGEMVTTPLSANSAPFSVTPQGALSSIDIGSSESLAYTIANTGSAAIALSSALSGTNASEYSVSPSGAFPCGSSLTAGQSCQMIVTFAPLVAGTRNAVWALTDTNSSFQVITPLSAGATDPEPVITPSGLPFTNVTLGTTKTATLTINAVFGHAITTSYETQSGPTNFTFDKTSCSSTPCTITISYTPIADVIDDGLFFVTDAVTSARNDLQIIGHGGAAIVSLSTTSLSFALRTHGTTSISQPVTLTNTGDIALTINSVGFTGTTPGDFSLQSNSCTGSIAAGSSCSMSVSYSPIAAGTSSANLQIVSSASSSPDLVTLSGTAN